MKCWKKRASRKSGHEQKGQHEFELLSTRLIKERILYLKDRQVPESQHENSKISNTPCAVI